MARIPRKAQKVFAGSANNNGVFGSAADDTKILSGDIDDIQSKAAYNTGWIDAVVGDRKFPALEEFQALHYMTTSQIAYIMQEGIPAYNADTVYYTNSIVKKAGTYEIYGSLTNENEGNALTDTDNWELLQDLSASFDLATESSAGIAEIATVEEVRAGTDDERFITPLKFNPFKIPTGAVMNYAFTTAPDGWVLVSGRTIGSAASGATNRANADTLDLFTGLWNTYNNTLLPIQDSSGSPTTRGVSAAADFAANKRLPTLDARGRVLAGLDNMGGTPAGRLSGQVGGVNGLQIGAGGGAETHSLNANQNGPHFHYAGMPHIDDGQFGADGGFNGVRTAGFGNASTRTTSARTSTEGQGSPHNNVQPTLVLPVIMKL